MKRVYITTLLTCIAVLALFFGLSRTRNINGAMKSVTVGFIFENDESVPYTYNFARAQVQLEEELRDDVDILVKNNVPDEAVEETLHDLAVQGCNIIFTNCHSDSFIEYAPSYPGVQICQVNDMIDPPSEYPENYHTFNGKFYQGRYAGGVAAGLKLQEMIKNGVISPDEAIVGYVGAFPAATVISGYSAFLVGVRSVVPEAVMKVRYTGTWSSYRKEKACTTELIDEGCVVLSQHTDTIGPAIACEEAAQSRPLVFVGRSESFLDVAPATALLSIRVNWTPYVIGAVQAVMQHRKIESIVDGDVHGNDVSMGFEHNVVEILDLNTNLAAKGTKMVLDNAIEAVKSDPAAAYRGNYTGKDAEDSSDTIDLKKGYTENAQSSAPSFHYILDDVVEVLDA